MFRLVHWKTIGKGVLRTFTLSLGEWETIAEGGLDILGSIPYDPRPAQFPQCNRLCWKHLRIPPSDLGALQEVHCQKPNDEEEEVGPQRKESE